MNKIHIISLAAMILVAHTACKHPENNELDHGHSHQNKTASEEGTHAHADNEIIIEPEQALRFGIQTEVAEPKPFSSTIRTTGQLLPSTTDPGVISAVTSGVISISTPVRIGSKISKGQVVANIAARSSSGDNPNSAALAAVSAAKRELDRIRPLLDDGIATMSEYNAALTAYETAKAAVSQSSISGKVVSTVSGTVLEILCVNGQYVQTGEVLIRVSQNNLVTLQVNVPSSRANSLQSITDALVQSPVTGVWTQLSTMGGKRIDHSDIPSSGNYIPIFFEFHASKDYMPGSNVEVDLVEPVRKYCIVVPRSALIEQGGEYYIFEKTGDHSYIRTRVECGAFSGDSVEILSGIKAGDCIVIEGVQTVKMAEASTAVPEGHSHNH